MKKLVAVILTFVVVFTTSSFSFASLGAKPIKFSEIPGIKVGHYTDLKNATGTTVIIAENPDGAIGGADVRGGSPGTRETDLLDPTKTVQTVNAICLTGGSAFGLDAAGGVMKFLEEKKMGVDVGVTVVPIVPTAVIFDLAMGPDASLGKDMVRPGIAEGYKAAENAFLNLPWQDGNVGGGTGASAGGMKGGLGSYAYKFGDLYVGAIVVANPAGQVINPKTGEIVAGKIDEKTNTFVDMETWTLNDRYVMPSSAENTTIGLIVTNASLTKAQTNKLAEMAHDGYARAIQPTHTVSDGDTIFAMSLGDVDTNSTTWGQSSVNLNLLGVLAVNAMENAIYSAAYNAETLHNRVGAATLREEGKTPAQPEKSKEIIFP